MTTWAATQPTANDRLKRSFDTTLAASLLVATGLHLLAFELFPTMNAPNWGEPVESVIEAVRMEEYKIPDKPVEMARPSAPVATVDAPIDATLPTIGFEEYVDVLPPPSQVTSDAGQRGIAFTPYTVPPRLLNPAEVERALERAYPPALRDAGLGGTVTLLVHIDDAGQMLEARVGEGSGFGPIDQAALGLADIMRFSPAMNRDVKVAVWIQLPLTFEVR